jgi:hypothetical protein
MENLELKEYYVSVFTDKDTCCKTFLYGKDKYSVALEYLSSSTSEIKFNIIPDTLDEIILMCREKLNIKFNVENIEIYINELTKYAIEITQIAISCFVNYIENADHLKPATLDLILNHRLHEMDIINIRTDMKNFDSHKLFYNNKDIILSIDQLKAMTSDLKNHLQFLESEFERNASIDSE